MAPKLQSSREAKPLFDVWSFDLSAQKAEVGRLTALLSHEERERGGRFVIPEHANWFYVAHGRLREILASYLNVPPQEIAFSPGMHGKPWVSTPRTEICFNLSHSDSIASVTVAATEVGIDLERIKQLHNPAEVEGALAPGEQQALSAFEGRARLEAFYRCWTRKEAVMKALGSGLGTPLESFEVPVTSESEVHVTLPPALSPSTWRVTSFEPRPGFVGAVAIRADQAMDRTSVSWRMWPETV
jgi:4'-phosphopantetheinyl transferase